MSQPSIVRFITSDEFNVNSIKFDKTDMTKSFQKLRDPSNQYQILNIDPRYHDSRTNKLCTKLNIKSPFMLIPYGISAYTEQKRDMNGNLVEQPNVKPQYTMSVSFQHSADEKTQYSPEKFEIISENKVQKLESELQKMDTVIMEKLLQNDEFRSFFMTTFGDKLQDFEWDGKDARKAYKIAGGKPSYVLPRAQKPGEERSPYAYPTFKVKALYRQNKENNEKEFFFDMRKRDIDTNTTPLVPKEDYIQVFGSEMKGCVARFVFKIQVWVNANSKTMGIKYILTNVEYIPFQTIKSEVNTELDVDEDEEAALAILKSKKGITTRHVNVSETIQTPVQKETEDNVEDAVEPDEEEDEEESEEEVSEEEEPEPVISKKSPVAKATRGRGGRGNSKA